MLEKYILSLECTSPLKWPPLRVFLIFTLLFELMAFFFGYADATPPFPGWRGCFLTKADGIMWVNFTAMAVVEASEFCCVRLFLRVLFVLSHTCSLYSYPYSHGD